MTIDATRPLQTRDGRAVAIEPDDGRSIFLHGKVDGDIPSDRVRAWWRATGKPYGFDPTVEHDLDLVQQAGSDDTAADTAPATPAEQTFTPDWRLPSDMPKDQSDLPEAERWRLAQERMRLLHIFGAESNHDDVRIVGNRNALVVLRDALTAALESGKAETGAVVRDGEGFGIEIELNDAAWESPAWETLPLPYSDPIARGEPDPWSAVVRLQHALRQANAQLVKRGVKPVADPTAEGP